MKFLFGFVALILSANAFPGRSWFSKDAANVCGYEGCPKPVASMLNVHLVPHSHDDVGWLKTVDQYYYGSRIGIQRAGVQYILDSVVQSLLRNPERRFIYVESEFFFTWWEHQTPELQEQVKMLVNEGRLELTGGAWSMNDEATTHYQSIVDQFTWGLGRLNDTFGDCGRPRAGWQIDMFGHSREMASLLSQMGFDGMFFARLDYEDKRDRLSKQTAEFIWRANAHYGEEGDLMTSALYNHYSAPPGFCFDLLCQDDPIIDENIVDNNVKEKVDKFIEFIDTMSPKFKSNNLIITMGDDFHWQDAEMYYKNVDKLIRYVNARQESGSTINLLYSTPACYLKALHESNVVWPTYDYDFFPYSTDPHSFWTGYFTSRPTLKRFERQGNNFLQVCKQLTATVASDDEMMEQRLTYLREEMGIMQHHDAVTGTEKQHVADDYARRLHSAFVGCNENAKILLNELTTGEKEETLTFGFENCLQLNISSCDVSDTKDNFIVTLYNPLGHATYEYVRFPVSSVNYEVTDSEGTLVPVQFVPVADAVKALEYRESTSDYELIFKGEEIPAMGYKSFYVSKTATSNTPPVFTEVVNEEVVGGSVLSITIATTGLLSSITYNGEESPLSQNFFYYEGALGNNMVFENRSSGAYIFRPDSPAYVISDTAVTKITRGDLVDEVHQVFDDWVSQVIRVYKDEDYVEFEWMVGSIPVDDGIGKEIITKYMSNIDSKGEFWTDSNGRQMLKRSYNYRTYPANIEETISGNYYPIISKLAVEDETHRMAVLIDRAQGGTSLNDGEIELMVHRKLLHDDAFGVGEALIEDAYGKGLIARGKHYLVFGEQKSTSPTLDARERILQAKVLLASWPFFSDASSMTVTEWQSQYNNNYGSIKVDLPPNIHLMTFEPWKDGSALVRFEHILEADEDPEHSKAVTINLKEIFGASAFEEALETNLAANQWIGNVNRFKYTTADKRLNDKSAAAAAENDDEEFDVTLNAMEIRTFVLTTWKTDTTSEPDPEPDASSTIHQFLIFNFVVTIVTVFLRNSMF